MGEKTNVAPGKRHIVGQCNNNDLFNKVIISHSEAEGNKRNIRHVCGLCDIHLHRVLQYRKEESNNLNVRWPRVAPSCPSPVLGFGETWS